MRKLVERNEREQPKGKRKISGGIKIVSLYP